MRVSSVLPGAADLADHGIHLRSSRTGEQRTACPQCATAKHRPGDDALAVRVEADGHAVWHCHRCGWKGSTGGKVEPSARAEDVRPATPPAPAPRNGWLSVAAARLWRDCRPINHGSPVAAYLRSRGCPVPRNHVRWHGDMRHPGGHSGPCMVALVTDVLTGDPLNLHMTWVQPDGSGKAAIDKPRLLFKGHRKAGGVIRLWPDEDVTQGLCIAEGIETALSAAVGFGLAWATIDAGNMKGFPVLEGVEALTIVADHDQVNKQTGERPGLAAAEACAKRWAEAGREARLWHAPEEGGDFNDFARGAAA